VFCCKNTDAFRITSFALGVSTKPVQRKKGTKTDAIADSHNGERIGTYHGHQGALWTVDVNPSSELLATGGADNTMRLWHVQTGKLLHTWEFNTSIKRCEFSPDGRQLLGVTEKRSGHLSTICVYPINPDPEAQQSDEQLLRIVCDESKATVAGFSYLAKYIISGHEDGSVTQWDGKTGELLSSNYDVHEPDMQISEYLDTVQVWTATDNWQPTFSGHLIGHTSSQQARTRQPR